MSVNKKRKTYWLPYQTIELLETIAGHDEDHRSMAEILEGLILQESKRLIRVYNPGKMRKLKMELKKVIVKKPSDYLEGGTYVQ